MAATRLAACALYPPMLPAMAEPTRFLLMFTSTRASVVVFKTCSTRSRTEPEFPDAECLCLHDAFVLLFRPGLFYLVNQILNVNGNIPDKISSSYLSDHFSRDGGLTDSRLAPAFDPVDSGRFLVGAVVPTDSYHLQFWEVLLQSAQSLLCTLQAQVHTRFTFPPLFTSLSMCDILSNNSLTPVNGYDYIL